LPDAILYIVEKSLEFAEDRRVDLYEELISGRIK